MVSKSMFQRIYKAKIWQGRHFDVSYEINFFFIFKFQHLDLNEQIMIFLLEIIYILKKVVSNIEFDQK